MPTALTLTQAQLGIWLGQQRAPHSAAYLTAEAIEITGPLDTARLDRAAHEVFNACDTLHMSFHAEAGQVWQRVHRGPWGMTQVDLHDPTSPPEARWARAQQWMRAALAQPIDLARDRLFDTALLRLAPTQHLWFVRAHHIALDGFGHALLASAVAERYAQLGQALSTPPPLNLPGDLGPVVAEDEAYQRSPACARDRAYWLSQLSDAHAVSLAPAAPLADSVRRLPGRIAAADMARWQAAAQASRVDLATWLCTGVALWLHQHTGCRDVTLGLPVMNRLGSTALKRPCMAMNIVPLRVRIAPEATARALTQHISAQLRAQRPHQRYRYEALRHDLGRTPAHTRDGQRLFGPVLNLMPFERALPFGPGLHAQSHALSAGPVEDLAITLSPRAPAAQPTTTTPHDTAADWQFDLEANPQAYSAEALAQAHKRLVSTLDALAQQPDAPALRAPQGGHHILCGGPLPQPSVPVLHAFLAHARATPERSALEQDTRRLSYGELLHAVQQLAGQLAAHGVGQDDRVAVLLPRSPQAITAVLAVLWVGACYVPLDPASPAARIAMVLGNAHPALVLTERASLPLVGAQRSLCLDAPLPNAPPQALPAEVDDDALAYLIYTSGSTGRPNGVMVGRHALAHFIAGASARYGIERSDRMLQFAPLHFDASVEEIFLPLTAGGTLVLRTEAMLDSLTGFVAACAAQRITVLDLPTAFWHELAHGLAPEQGALALPAGLRLLIIGGEAAWPERVARWRALAPAHIVLLNTYGPTETTVICTSAVLAGPGSAATPAGETPIGRPLAGLSMVIVDAQLQPLPRSAGPQASGELCVMGPALAQGYLGQPERTAQRFITLPGLPGAPRAYRTGDLVRLDANGQLHYLGRLDDELKISGHRIDPSEIETALLALPGVHEAAVVGQTGAHGDKHLVAWIAAQPMPSGATLRQHLSARLPAAAVPAVFAPIARLPRNLNNKIDRAALQARALSDLVPDLDPDLAPAVAPDTPTEAPSAWPRPDASPASPAEHAVMRVWHEVLGRAPRSTGDDFFALGGKSLQAIQTAHRLGLALQREVPVSLLFAHPTVAALAAAALRQTARQAPPRVGHTAPQPALGQELAPLLPIQREGQGPALFCVHPAEGLSWCYFGLSRALPGIPLWGLQAQGITEDDPASFEAMVSAQLQRLRAQQAHGPYRLLGWSSGGGIAHALAAALQAQGERVELLALMDAYPAEAFTHMPAPQTRDALEALLDVIGASPLDAATGQPLPEAALRALLRQPTSTLAALGEPLLDRLVHSAQHTMALYRRAQHPRFEGDMLFFHATQRRPGATHDPRPEDWAPHTTGRIRVVPIHSSHSGMCQPTPLAAIGAELGRVLALCASPSR